MRGTSRAVVFFGLAASAAVLVLAAGCSQPKSVTLQPKVSQPAIKEAGVLRAGVDLGYPPFAGTDSGQQAGLDVDVAAALAERLGLKLSLVDVKPSDAATALADGTADVVLSVPFTGTSLSDVSLAGSYVSDSSGFFVATDTTASIDPTLTLKTLPAPPAKIGVQSKSASYWKLVQDLGPDSEGTYTTLREAFQALDTGEVPVVAGDVMVGAYIGRDYPTIHFAGQYGDGTLLGVAVAPENTTLSDAARSALDSLSADGVLDTIRLKWVGSLPKPSVASSETSDSTATATP
jgi:polar amino acid transport system substrate-binding protein